MEKIGFKVARWSFSSETLSGYSELVFFLFEIDSQPVIAHFSSLSRVTVCRLIIIITITFMELFLIDLLSFMKITKFPLHISYLILRKPICEKLFL